MVLTQYIKIRGYWPRWKICCNRKMFKKSCIYQLAPTRSMHHKNNSQSSSQTKSKPCYCTKFVIAPVNGFHRVLENAGMYNWILKINTSRDISACRVLYAVLFQRRKSKKMYQKSKENISLKTCFCYFKLQRVTT